MSQNAPLSVPYLAMLIRETAKVSLVAMLEATSVDAVAEFVNGLLAQKGWDVEGVRKRASRVEPRDRAWARDGILARNDSRARTLRMVARGAFSAEAWGELHNRLQRHGAGEPCDPIDGLGYPTIFPESQVAFWFYPFDPALPGLPTAADPETMTRLLLGHDDNTLPLPDGMPRVSVERVRYVPEVGAILRYQFETSGGPLTIYGKVQPGDRGLRAHRIVEGLWSAKVPDSKGLLNLPRPLGFIEKYGLLLEQAIPGTPVRGNRLSTEFRNAALAATSYDLGKYCAYIVPSSPQSWEDTVAAEETRLRFLRHYLELRPHATIDRFPIYEALQLALRAMSFMWAQTSGWERTAETFLVMAHERLYSRLPGTF